MQEVLIVPTKANFDAVNITSQVSQIISKYNIEEGLAVVFVAGSTGTITTIEYEVGAVADLKKAIEKLAPQNENYEHNKRWDDGNGFSHVRAALMRPSLSIPIKNGEMVLGTWQQIVVLNFDNRDRERKIIVQVIKE